MSEPQPPADRTPTPADTPEPHPPANGPPTPADTPNRLPPADGPPTPADLWEILRLPLLLALAAVAGSWLIWYFTSTNCPMELAQITGCNPSRLAQYINLDALNKIAAHGVIAGSGGGLWSYAMITRERRAREDQAKQFAEERVRNAEERQAAAERLEEERRRSDARLEEERQRSDARLLEERRLAEERQAEERRQSAETLQAVIQQLTEDRAQTAEERAREQAQAAEERRQLMSHIEFLTQRITDQQNGNNRPTSQ